MTNGATNVTSSSAILNGTVTPNGLTTNVYFQYGITTNYGHTTASQPFTGNIMRTVFADISGLSRNTTYHFRLVGSNNGGTIYGSDVTFDTNTTGPMIVTSQVTNKTSSSATLNGRVNPNGVATSVHFEYGATASYGFTTPSQPYTGSTTQPVSADIAGFGPNTPYHFRLSGDQRWWDQVRRRHDIYHARRNGSSGNQ